MTLYYQDDHVTLYHGDCMDVMASLPAESVDAIVTSPPYAMQRKSTYGGIPEKDYPEWTVAWMAEARRLLKPDGSVIINITPHKVKGGLSDYVLRTRLEIRGDGWTEIDELVWHKTTGIPSGNRAQPRRMWESLLWYAKHPRPWSDPLAEGHTTTRTTDVARIARQKAKGWSHHGGLTGSTPTVTRTTNVVSMPADATRGIEHPARFPPRLAEWCGKLVMPPGGTILDPFNGSASTGVAALRNGWDYIGIDSVEEYVGMSARRLAVEQSEASREIAARRIDQGVLNFGGAA